MDVPSTPTKTRNNSASTVSPLHQPQSDDLEQKQGASSGAAYVPLGDNNDNEPQRQPIDDESLAVLTMLQEDDGFDIEELQRAMAMSVSVDKSETIHQQNDADNDEDAQNDEKQTENDDNVPQNMDVDTPLTPVMTSIEALNDDEDDDKDDEKQIMSPTFIATSRSLQMKRTQYHIVFNLIQSKMLNIVHNALLFCSSEQNNKDKIALLESEDMLKAFASIFISMANTQASSSSNWQSQYEHCLKMYQEIISQNYLYSEYNRHILSFIQNAAAKEEEEEDEVKKDENGKDQKKKRLTSDQIEAVPFQPRYDCEEKKIIGMDGDLLEFPTKWNLRYLHHFIIHPHPLQLEYKEKSGKSLIVTTDQKLPFICDYYFEIKIIKIEPNESKNEDDIEDKIGNLSIGLRSDWGDYFVANSGYKWTAKRRFLQFDTDSLANTVNTNAPEIDFFQSFIDDKLFQTKSDKEKSDKDKEKKDKADLITSMLDNFQVGDYIDVYDDDQPIPFWKSGKITNIEKAEKIVVVRIFGDDLDTAFDLKTKDVYNKLAPFNSKYDNASPSIKERDINPSTEYDLQRFGVGDCIGCGINLVDGKIFFTKNGERFPGNNPTFDGVPLFDYWPSIEIRNANIMIEANFGQQEFQYKDVDRIKKPDNKLDARWKERVKDYEEQLNAQTKQALAAKRNREAIRAEAAANRYNIAERIANGGLLAGINQKQLLRGIEFNQDDPNRVVDWALNQENYEAAFAELGPSKSEREIEAEQIEKNKKKERLMKLESISMALDNQNSLSPTRQTIEKSMSLDLEFITDKKQISIPTPNYRVVTNTNNKQQRNSPYASFDAHYDGISLDYGFNVEGDLSDSNVSNILPIYYTQTVSNPVVEKWLTKVQSGLVRHGMDRFTMIEILTRLRANPQDMVALMQAREIYPSLEQCPVQRNLSAASTGSQSPMSPSKNIKRSVKEVNVTPDLLNFGVRVQVKSDDKSRFAMKRAKVWVNELEKIRSKSGQVIYVDEDTKPKLALVLFENNNEGKLERWWLPLEVLQLVILDYNSSTMLPPHKLAKLYLHHINKTSSSIAKICVQLLFNLCPTISDINVPFDSIQNYQYYASLIDQNDAKKNEYVADKLKCVGVEQQQEALNDIIHSVMEQFTTKSSAYFIINLSPTQNALNIRQNAYHYKVSMASDILIEIINDPILKSNDNDALTIYGDRRCTHILYRAKLHELKPIRLRESEIWISVTGESELALSIAPIPRLMNLFLSPSVRDQWKWNLALINCVIDGYFQCDNIPTMIASEWMLSISHILKNALNDKTLKSNIQKQLQSKENVKIKESIQSWMTKLQSRRRFCYRSDMDNEPDKLALTCLHS